MPFLTDLATHIKTYIASVPKGDTTTTEGALINSATAKTTPADADMVGLMDSAASNILKKLSWANIKATLKTYFDTLYQAVLVSGTNIKTLNSNSLLGSGNIVISASTAETVNTLTSVSNIDCSSYTFFNISLSGTSGTLNVINVPDNTIINFLILSTSSTGTAITMPTTNNYKSRNNFQISQNHYRMLSLIKISTNYFWTISSELV